MDYPSIFNDVLGPVMRGPSSSHSAAALRIGRIAADLMKHSIKDVLIEYDPNGSLVTTHKSQGSDMGLYGGFLGWDTDDARLPSYEKFIHEAGINIKVKYLSYGADHPNTYKLTFSNDLEVHEMTGLSLGGGMIEIVSIDKAPVSLFGDYWEALIFTENPDSLYSILSSKDFDGISKHVGSRSFVNVKSRIPFEDDFKNMLLQIDENADLRLIAPVLPVLSKKDLSVPFITVKEMLEYSNGRFNSLWELALEYESARSGQSHVEIFQNMQSLLGIMRNAVKSGLKGTEYEDRILPCQSTNFKELKDKGSLIEGNVLNEIIMQITAIMEVKSSMGVIVAAPTAGSCGALPGALLGTATAQNIEEIDLVKGMLAAGLIGVFISAHSTFSAEEGGCMAECGSGSCMAGAGLVTMTGGTLDQALGAASMALQNSLGMICDPIGNRVEAPCLGRNVMAATNAVSCANMALADYLHLIPLDEVIEAMAKVGKAIPHELCCTALGGLSVTATAKEIEDSLENGGIMKFKSC